MGSRPKSATGQRNSLVQRQARNSIAQAPDTNKRTTIKAARSPKEIAAAKKVISPIKQNYTSNTKLSKNKSPTQEVTISTDLGSKTMPAHSRKSTHNFANSFSMTGVNSRTRFDTNRKSMNNMAMS